MLMLMRFDTDWIKHKMNLAETQGERKSPSNVCDNYKRDRGGGISRRLDVQTSDWLAISPSTCNVLETQIVGYFVDSCAEIFPDDPYKRRSPEMMKWIWTYGSREPRRRQKSMGII